MHTSEAFRDQERHAPLLAHEGSAGTTKLNVASGSSPTIGPRTWVLKTAAVGLGVTGVLAFGGLKYLEGPELVFPGELERFSQALLVGAGLTGILFRRFRTLMVTAAAALLVWNVFLTAPGLAGQRLHLLHAYIPVASEPSSGCYCATRGSLHELFGPPDIGLDQGLGNAYGYWLRQEDSRGDLVVFVFSREDRGRPDARVARIVRYDNITTSPLPQLQHDPR